MTSEIAKQRQFPRLNVQYSKVAMCFRKNRFLIQYQRGLGRLFGEPAAQARFGQSGAMVFKHA